MITKDNFQQLLHFLTFTEDNKIFTKHFAAQDCKLAVDFEKQILIYPEDKGLIINERQTCNFSDNENFVVFECVHRLLEKGYLPQHIELEPKWKVGHGASGGRADILVRNQENKPLLLIECKTADKEFEKAWKETLQDGGQLFSYAQQISGTEFLCLYASDFANQKLSFEHYIITIKDIQNEVEKDSNKEIKRVFYKDAQDAKQRFLVWKDTYLFDYQTVGIFEESIQAYNIGKEKIRLQDLRYITNSEMKAKFNEFAEILRKYNVSSKESAFDKLITLFLCKIVDETESHVTGKPLDFYWRGQYADDYFSLLDRLQRLYKEGMQEYLGETITYIDNKTVIDGFGFYKNRNATRDYIVNLFKQQKYFTNSDFGFIEVHNQKLFFQNAEILLDVVRMWQDFQLNGEQQNQFLSDMFEIFLDKGFKQSEGQFFTPIPICKFVLQSLPLEKMIKEHPKTPKVMDYACGSGHFLTEYATQAKKYVGLGKEQDIKKYYQNIFGVEKEYRLSKVAKISAFMYGQDEINIIYCDALNNIQQEIKSKIVMVEDETVDILVANPPFAVENFLTTLPADRREKYALFQQSKTNLATDNIQCFFLERAKQLLAPNGVAGIVVPISVLSNDDTIHRQTRELLLKYFDIVSIAELGKGTFGKSKSTSTVVLFLRRKAQRPEYADHFWNRTQDYFDDGKTEIATAGGEYKDLHLLKRYCQHINIPFEDYQLLLVSPYQNPQQINKLLDYEVFRLYQTDFDKSADIRKLKESKSFKVKTATEQEKEIALRFLKYTHAIEMDKFYYFLLAYNNGGCGKNQDVLLIKSPTDAAEQKIFLGYEWSERQKHEGIKYNGGDIVHDIITPLFNPKDAADQSKISYLIQQSFQQNEFAIPEHLQQYASKVKVLDLLNFTKIDFNKTISLNSKQTILLETNYNSVQLGNLCTIIRGVTYAKNDETNEITDNLVLTADNITLTGEFELNKVVAIAPYVQFDLSKKLYKNDIFMCFASGSKAHIGKVAFITQDLPYFAGGFMGILRPFEEVVYPKYLFEILNTTIFRDIVRNDSVGANINNLSSTINQIKIPLPPLEIQEKIVLECEAIDKMVENAKTNIANIRQEIENKVLGVFGNYPEKKLADVCLLNPSKTEIKNVDENTIVSFVEMASVSNDGFIAEKVDTPLKDLKKGSYTYFAENDIIIAKITPCMENGKCALATNLTNSLGMGSSEFHVIRVKDEVLNKYIFALLNREVIRKEAEQNMTGSSGHRRVPANFYADYKIPVPPLSTQATLVSEIEKLELQITENQGVINDAKAKKEGVLKRYL